MVFEGKQGHGQTGNGMQDPRAFSGEGMVREVPLNSSLGMALKQAHIGSGA